MKILKRVTLAGFTAMTLLPPATAWPAESGHQLPSAKPANTRENGGFLELGIVATLEQHAFAPKDPADNGTIISLNISPSLSGGYQYERLFFEATDNWLGGLNLGVNLAHTDNWSVDLLLANIAGSITDKSDEPPRPDTEVERNNAILDRDSLFIAAGTRVTGYSGDSIVQLRLLSDWYDNNGLLGSAHVGRQWQLGNWNLQGLLGAGYNSADFNNYLYGISVDEATERFPLYTAGSAWIPEVEFSASIPINKDWIYASRLRIKQLPSSVTDSPIVSEDSEMVLQTGIHYVF